MSIKLRIYIIVMLLSVPGNIFPREYRFRNYSTEDGLSQPYIYSICQDTLGYLWVGTGEGLSRFNGFSFEKFTTAEGLPSNFVTCTLNNGKEVWFGHGNGDISFFNGRIFSVVPFTDSISDRITCLSRDFKGDLWASTFTSGIYRLNRESMSFEKIIYDGGLMVNAICHVSSSEILAGTNSGLYLFSLNTRGEMMSDNIVSGIPETKITSLTELRNGNYLIATENDGLFELEKDKTAFKASAITGKNELSGVQHVYEDTGSALWIATYGQGLIRLIRQQDKNQYQSFRTRNGFYSDNVRTVFGDREGNIWSGNFGEGLTIITPEAFSVFYPDEVQNSVFSILADGDFLWIGTAKGLIRTERATGKIVHLPGNGKGIPSDTVTALFLNDKKDLWVGTEKNGIFRLNPENGSIQKFRVPGTLENSITCIAGEGGIVYIGTKKGLFVYDSGTGAIAVFTIVNGLPHNWINSIYPDRKGNVWITTKSKILVYFKEGHLEKYPVIMGAGTSAPVALTGDTYSQIWTGSAGNGIFIIKGDSVINLSMRNGLLSDYCYSLINSGKYIWVAHRSGLSRISTKDFAIKAFPASAEHENIKFNPNAVTSDDDGRIMFGSDQGLFIYDPSSDIPVMIPPVLGITSIFINDNKTAYHGGRLVLPPGRYSIRIEYLGCSLREPQYVTYLSMLEGYDRGWSESTHERSVTYPSLAEGKYSFLLKAANSDGFITGKPLRLNIFIRKPVWKYWWFFPVMALICAALVFNYIKYRERRLRAEKKILESRIKERTRELEDRKNEIEQQRDEINEKNLNITSSITYARQIQKALLTPPEILDRAFPDSFIMHKPRDIVSGDFYWLAERDDKLIFTVADCTGHGVPGAFMSLLGITLLNEIVNVHGITRSDDIVNELRRRVINSLQQQRREVTTRDGMDISLCVMDKKTGKIQFTGAMNDMIRIRDGKLDVIRADYLDVSISFNHLGHFKCTEFDYRKGDMLYLFTDGYQDQFGGQFDKKFLRPHFYTTLVEVHKYPVLNQLEILEKKLDNWMKGRQQTDDITILGIRIQ